MSRTPEEREAALDEILGPDRHTRRSAPDPDAFARVFWLDDINIQRSGDGRVVLAYAAMFHEPYEVKDQHGHYMEVIHRSAFDRHLSKGDLPLCLYNHGMSLHGTPDALATVPLGTPLEVRPDSRGLWTITRYNKTALADSVLEAIRAGDIKHQSFRGRIHRSNPDRVPRRRDGEPLPTITRMEMGLADYGPTPIAVNKGAAIMAVRSGGIFGPRRREPIRSMAELRAKIAAWRAANPSPYDRY